MVDVRGMEPRSEDVVFDEWIRQLKEDVICGDYGYEDGEFDVFPEQWRPLFDEGLRPQEAFERALKAFADNR